MAALMMGRGCYAKLSEAMTDHADAIAKKINLPMLSARAQAACKVWFNPIEWNVGDDSKATLGSFIEVCAVSKDNETISLKKIIPHFAYVLISAENHPYYWLAGWMWGADMNEEKKLQPMFLLNQIVRAQNEGQDGQA